jgi:isoleucyl-tRNA synthetase
MKANLIKLEPIKIKFWNKYKIYNNIRQHFYEKKIFFLHDGPPYANGNIHIGHAINKILKDIIIKFKTLSGINSPYIPGWDCHGLPIEHQIEKKINKYHINKNLFRIKCRKYAKQQVIYQKNDFIQLGILADWDNLYLTMHYKFEANIIKNLSKIIKNNHLTRGFKPVYWCSKCSSSLAEAEIEYKNKISSTIYIKCEIINYKSWVIKLNIKNINCITSLIIWTTTPSNTK